MQYDCSRLVYRCSSSVQVDVGQIRRRCRTSNVTGATNGIVKPRFKSRPRATARSSRHAGRILKQSGEQWEGKENGIEPARNLLIIHSSFCLRTARRQLRRRSGPNAAPCRRSQIQGLFVSYLSHAFPLHLVFVRLTHRNTR